MQEAATWSASHLEQPVRLGLPGGDLGDELGRPDAHRAGDVLLIGDHRPDVLADLAAAPNIRTEPVRSKNASSIDADSTTEDTDLNTETIAFDTAV